MQTETQKNFKKQMQEIQKELGNKKQDQYYNYIEGTHIENYYKKRKRGRRIAGISLGSLISAAFLGYSLFSWLQPLFASYTNHNARPITVYQGNAFNTKNLLHKEIASYVSDINKFDEEINGYISFINANLSEVLKDQSKSKAFTDKLSSYVNSLNASMAIVSSLKPSEQLEDYHNAVINYYTAASNYMLSCINAANFKDNVVIDKMNECSRKMNHTISLKRKALLDTFDKAGVKYEVSTNQITYWLP